MGLHFGFIAASATVARLKESFRMIWPTREFAQTQAGFKSFSEALDWAASHEKFVSAAEWSRENPGSQVRFFYQDGPWAVMTDPSYSLAGDEKALARLSAELDAVLGVVIETAGGTAVFAYCEKGNLLRSVAGVNGELHVNGTPIPQEARLAKDSFYMDEVEQLMQAFGLTPYGDDSLAPKIEAWEIIDRTDYEALRRERTKQ